MRKRNARKPPAYDPQDKVALITGGAQGIGLGIAQALAKRQAKTALVDLDTEKTKKAAETLNALPLTADVTDAAALEAAIDQTIAHFGRLDIVIANAGIAPTPATTNAMPHEEFERVLEVNLLGVYRTVKAALPHIIESEGQLVLVSSVYAFMNGMLVAPYAVAKAGVEQLGRALNAELSLHNATATVAYFGFVDTDMVRKAIDERPTQAQELTPAFLRKRITPQQAGEAVASAIEQRSPRVIAPRYWAVASTLRGLINPALDRLSTKSTKIQQALTEADGSGSLPSATD